MELKNEFSQKFKRFLKIIFKKPLLIIILIRVCYLFRGLGYVFSALEAFSHFGVLKVRVKGLVRAEF